MNVISQVSILFFLIVLGYICAKTKLAVPEAPNIISPIIMNVTLPCLILVSFQRPFSRELLGEAGLAIAASLLMYGISLPVALIYPRLLNMRGPERGVHRYALLFTNCGYLGYPITEAILGTQYIFHASFFNILFNVAAYSLGVWFISKEGDRKMKFSLKTLLNPSTIFTFVGLLLFLFSVKLPAILVNGIRTAGDMTSPLSMLVIGMSLARANVRQVWGNWRIYVTTILRLLLLPALIGLVCWLVGIRGSILVLTLILCAMPAAATTSVMASFYHSAPEEGSALVFITTLFSMVSIPLLVLAANALPL